MMDRHYSPVARLVLLPHGDRAALREAARKARASSLRVGALLMGLSSDEAIDSALQMPTEAAGYARELYHALHRLDDLGLDEVLVEAPPEGPQWAAVLDRLRRAAARL